METHVTTSTKIRLKAINNKANKTVALTMVRFFSAFVLLQSVAKSQVVAWSTQKVPSHCVDNQVSQVKSFLRSDMLHVIQNYHRLPHFPYDTKMIQHDILLMLSMSYNLTWFIFIIISAKVCFLAKVRPLWLANKLAKDALIVHFHIVWVHIHHRGRHKLEK